MNRPAWLGGHERWERRLHGYVDGSLDSGGRAAFERHLASCAACSGAVEEHRATRTLLRGLPERPAPRSFAITPEMAAEARSRPAANPARPVVVAAPIRPPAPVMALRFAQVTAAVAALGFFALLTVDFAGVADDGDDDQVAADAGAGATQEAMTTMSSAAGTPEDAGEMFEGDRETGAAEPSSTMPALPTVEGGGVSGQSVPEATPQQTPPPPATGGQPTTEAPADDSTVEQRTTNDVTSAANAYDTGAGAPDAIAPGPGTAISHDRSKTTLRAFEAVFASIAIGAAALAFFAARGIRSRT
ncbi:MAG: zf-HC2 domain-containing protein [Dehalococcoidia bacterium]|nr:zf-HC2 domain-containing protein [Dehalococcoidia bacterium]